MDRRRAPVLVALAAALVVPLAAGAARPLRTGLNDNGDLNGADAPLAAKRMRASGASVVRISLGWYAVVPAQKPDSWNPADPNDVELVPARGEKWTRH